MDRAQLERRRAEILERLDRERREREELASIEAELAALDEQGAEIAFYFETPIVKTGTFGPRQAYTVLQLPDGTFETKLGVSIDDHKRAARVYASGYRHEVSAAEAEQLRAAGFTVREQPIMPTHRSRQHPSATV